MRGEVRRAGFIPRSSALTKQIAVILLSFGYGQFARLLRRKLLQTKRFDFEFTSCIQSNCLIPFLSDLWSYGLVKVGNFTYDLKLYI